MRSARAIPAFGLAVWMCAACAAAATPTVGLGVFGGGSVPLAQADNATGSSWGFRLPVNPHRWFTVEPFFSVADGGHTEATIGSATYNRVGLTVLGYGATVAYGRLGLGAGFPAYPYVGLGSYRVSRVGDEPRTETGFTAGAGFGRMLPAGFAVHARGGFTIVPTGDTSRRSFDFNLGVQYRFVPVP